MTDKNTTPKRDPGPLLKELYASQIYLSIASGVDEELSIKYIIDLEWDRLYLNNGNRISVTEEYHSKNDYVEALRVLFKEARIDYEKARSLAMQPPEENQKRPDYINVSSVVPPVEKISKTFTISGLSEGASVYKGTTETLDFESPVGKKKEVYIAEGHSTYEGALLAAAAIGGAALAIGGYLLLKRGK